MSELKITQKVMDEVKTIRDAGRTWAEEGDIEDLADFPLTKIEGWDYFTTITRRDGYIEYHEHIFRGPSGNHYRVTDVETLGKHGEVAFWNERDSSVELVEIEPFIVTKHAVTSSTTVEVPIEPDQGANQ